MDNEIVKVGALVGGFGAASTAATGGSCPLCIVALVAGIATSAVGAALPGKRK